MKRNGLVFVPREPPKRVILYPTQDSASQQQQQQPNGLYIRAQTALVTTNHNETIQQSNNNTRLSRQQPLSSAPNSTSMLTEKPDNDGSVPNIPGQQTSLNNGQKIQNPYYANPFFRPRVITNQPLSTTNIISSPSSRDSSTVTTSVTIQTLPSSTATSAVVNKGRQPIYPKTQSSLFLLNGPSIGRVPDSDTAVTIPPAQDDSRRWAHSVASAPIARRVISDERPNAILKPSETNITNTTNNDLLKPKGTSATDIVISLMDTWRAPLNTGNTSATNIYTRNGGIRDDLAISGRTATAGEQLPATPPYLSVGTSSAASSNNQNWKKALVANFQKNSRNIPTQKLFHSKQLTVPVPPSISLNNDITINQQQKTERMMGFNGINNERAFQINEITPSIPSLTRKSSESLRVTKQDINTNIERSTSLQIQASSYSNPTTTTITNRTEDVSKPIEIFNSENVAHIPITIPSTLIAPKPPVNVEQQRAIITRVMIRRDFVKSSESKPPIPSSANVRSLIPPHSAKPGGLPTNNLVQVATTTENNSVTNPLSNSNRIYPQPQQTTTLSQKSLLSFTSINSTVKESLKIENNQQLNGITNDGLISTSTSKFQQSQVVTNTGAVFRSSSLSATANVELRRKKEEINNKAKKRAISASAVPNDG